MSDGHESVVAQGDGEVHMRAVSAGGKTIPQYGKREGWVVPADDHTPVGSRAAFSAQVRDLVARAGDRAMETLAAPENVDAYVTALMAGVRERDRTCMNLYPKMMKMVDAEQRIIHELWLRVGARSEEEARGYIAAAKSVEGAGPHDGAARCTDYLEAYLNLYPEQRGSVVKRLGGLVPVG